MRRKLSHLFFNVKPGEWELVLSLLLLLALNTLVLELSDVVATAGFVSRIGASELISETVATCRIFAFPLDIFSLTREASEWPTSPSPF
jgi:hypothetical protein